MDKIVAEYLHKWGNCTSIISLFDLSCDVFIDPSVEGVISYRLAPKGAVVFGDPVCSKDNLEKLVQTFQNFCAKQNKKVIYLSMTEKFTQWALNRHSRSAIEVGAEIILNPMDNHIARSGRKASMLRNKYNQSIRYGITVSEYTVSNEDLEKGMQEVRDTWLKCRKGPQINLLDVNMFAYRDHTRWFYAKHNDRIVGVLILNRFGSCNGWVLNMLMVVPDAPAVTSEFIVLSVLEILRTEGCVFFSAGAIPGPTIGRIEGMGLMSRWLIRTLHKTAQKIFNLSDRQRYWDKFSPEKQPVFTLFSKPRIEISDVMAIMQAMNAKPNL